MSGGIAYVYDPDEEFLPKCNLGLVELYRVAQGKDAAELKELITRHQQYTGSTVASRILANWSTEVAFFHKVLPTDYKRYLDELEQEDSQAEELGTSATPGDLPQNNPGKH